MYLIASVVDDLMMLMSSSIGEIVEPRANNRLRPMIPPD